MSRDTAVRLPVLCALVQCVNANAGLGFVGETKTFLKSQIAYGKDIGATFASHEIRVGGPTTDPHNLHQAGCSVFVVELAKPIEIQGSGLHGLRDCADISCFLTG
jgi:hypothetical protein